MTKKQKPQTGAFIFGIHPVIELLTARRRKVITLYTTKPTPKGWRDIERLLPKYPVNIQYVNRDVLHRMADSTDHQGVVALVDPFPFRKKSFDPNKHPFLVMLDGIQDPRNVGAIMRSAYCAGASGVVLIKKHAAPLTGIALKSSAGLAEHLEVYQAPSVVAAAQELKKSGYTLYLAAFGGDDAQACEFKKPLCIVIGNEAVGVSKDIYKYGTQITLSQRHADISYNASVAAGILLFLAGTKIKTI